MKLEKPDIGILREAEKQGLVASMTLILEPNQTELNEKLSKYFREQVPNFDGIVDEEDTEIVLNTINAYIKEKKIDKFNKPLRFPYSEGSEVYLIPLTEHIQVKVLIVDEYYGGGEYEKYIDISRFIIDEETTKKDVDVLIDFTKRVFNL